MIKILFCTPTFQTITHGPAKFARFVYEINKFHQDFEIRILTEGIDKERPDCIIKLETGHPWYLSIFWPLLHNYKYLKKIQKIQKTFSYDVLIFNNALIGLLSLIVKLKKSVSIGFVNDNECLNANLQTFSMNKKWFTIFFRRQLEFLAVKFFDNIIVCSDFLNKEIKKEYGVNEKKISMLYQSINLDNIIFNPYRFRKGSNNIDVVFVKSDFDRGGLYTLFDAINLIKEIQFTVHIFGPNYNVKALFFEYTNHILNLKIVFHGPSEQEEVFDAMKSMDILCIPAYREGLGVANIEGLAHGIPIVTTLVGGIKEVMDNGKNGWLCEPNNSKDLAAKILDCITASTEERLRRASAGRKFVEENFSHIDMFKNFVNIINDVTLKKNETKK